MPQVFEVVRNKDKKNIPGKILAEVPEGKKSIRSLFRSRALVKIQDGCDFRCSFCIIPFVRGRSVSVPENDITRQICRFIQQGYKEIVLTGVHLCLYGKDLSPRGLLLTLLQRIENLEGLGKIRLSSLDPRFMDDEILDHISTSEKICPHFHLSFQHGSDRILRRMGRHVSVGDYRQVIFKLQRQCPEAGIGCDIMVGFPGESEKDFEQTALFLEGSPLSYFHVFSYSPRPGTLAADWPQIDSRLIKERAAFLRRLSLRKNLEFRRQRLGKKEKSIVIQNNEGEPVHVLTGNYIKVFVDSCPFKERDEVNVKLIYTDAVRTRGEITV
jgi:threonylcarbamoyladenosine tRNA methylthiotransferase MtaB